MERSLEGLLSHLLEHIALTGDCGLSPSEFVRLVKSYYLSTNRNDVHTNASYRPEGSSSKPNTDSRFLEYTWKLLVNDPDIQVGEHGQYVNLTLAEAEASHHAPGAEAQKHNEYSSDLLAELNEAACGRQTQNFELSDTGVNGHRSSNADVSSLRAQVADTGAAPSVIEQSNINIPKIGQGSHQSGTENVIPKSIRIYASEKRMWYALTGHEPDETRIKSFDFTLLSVIAACGPKGILQHKLVETSGQDKRSVPHRTDRLHEAGHIVKEPITVLIRDTKGVRKLITSLCTLKQFAKDPKHQAEIKRLTDEVALKHIKKVRKHGPKIHAKVDNPENEPPEDTVNDDNALDPSKFTPQWIPDRSIYNKIHEVIHREGTKGATLFDIRNSIWGEDYKKPTEYFLSRLVDAWQISQPLHLRHLAIVRDTVLQSKSPVFIHYTYPNFKMLVDLGKASWEAVTTLPDDAVIQGVSASLDSKPELDEHGFPQIDPQEFHANDDATLSECARYAKRTSSPAPKQFLSRREIESRPSIVTSKNDKTSTSYKGGSSYRERSQASPVIDPQPSRLLESSPLALKSQRNPRELRRSHSPNAEVSLIKRPTTVGKGKGRPRIYQKFEGSEDLDTMDDDQIKALFKSRSMAEKYQKSKIVGEIDRRIYLGENRTLVATEVLRETDEMIQSQGQDPIFSKVRAQILYHYAGGPVPQPTKLDIAFKNLGPNRKGRGKWDRAKITSKAINVPYRPSIAAHTFRLVDCPTSTTNGGTKAIGKTRKRKVTLPDDLLPAKERKRQKADIAVIDLPQKKKRQYRKRKHSPEVSAPVYKYLPSMAAHSGSFLPFAGPPLGEFTMGKRPRIIHVDQSNRELPSTAICNIEVREDTPSTEKGTGDRIIPVCGTISLERMFARRYVEQLNDLNKSRDSVFVANSLKMYRRFDEPEYPPGKRFKLVVFRLEALKSFRWMDKSARKDEAPPVQVVSSNDTRESPKLDKVAPNIVEGVLTPPYSSHGIHSTSPPASDNSTIRMRFSTSQPDSDRYIISHRNVDDHPRHPVTVSEPSPVTFIHSDQPATLSIAGTEQARKRGRPRKRKLSPTTIPSRRVKQREARSPDIEHHQEIGLHIRAPQESTNDRVGVTEQEAEPPFHHDATVNGGPKTPSTQTVATSLVTHHSFAEPRDAPRTGISPQAGGVPSADIQLPASKTRWVKIKIIPDRLRMALEISRPLSRWIELKIGPDRLRKALKYNQSHTEVHQITEHQKSPSSTALISRRRPSATDTRISVGKVRRTGGSTAILRKDIIMDLVRECGGVAPTHKDMSLPFAVEWTKRGNPGMPETDTVRTAVNALCSAGKLRQLSFAYRSPEGIMRTKTMITLTEIAPTDPRVKSMQQELAKRGQRSYIPKEWLLSNGRGRHPAWPKRGDTKYTDLHQRFDYHQQRLQQEEQESQNRKNREETLSKLKSLLERSGHDNGASSMLPEISELSAPGSYRLLRKPKHWNQRFSNFVGERLGAGRLCRSTKQREGYFGDPVFQDPVKKTWHTMPTIHKPRLVAYQKSTAKYRARIERQARKTREALAARVSVPSLESFRSRPLVRRLSKAPMDAIEDDEIMRSSSESESEESEVMPVRRTLPKPKPARRFIRSSMKKRLYYRIVPDYMQPQQPFFTNSGTFGTLFDGLVLGPPIPLHAQTSLQTPRSMSRKPIQKPEVKPTRPAPRQIFHVASGTFGTQFTGYVDIPPRAQTTRTVTKRSRKASRRHYRKTSSTPSYIRVKQPFHGPSGTFGTTFGVVFEAALQRPLQAPRRHQIATNRNEAYIAPVTSIPDQPESVQVPSETTFTDLDTTNAQSSCEDSESREATVQPFLDSTEPPYGVQSTRKLKWKTPYVFDPGLFRDFDAIEVIPTFQDEVEESLAWELKNASRPMTAVANRAFINHMFPHDHEAVDTGPVFMDDGKIYTVKHTGRLVAKPLDFFESKNASRRKNIAVDVRFLEHDVSTNSFESFMEELSSTRKRRQVTFASDASGSARSEDESEDDMLGRSKIRRTKGPLALRQISEEDQHRLATCVIVVRCLAGGIDRRVDWPMVAKAFGGGVNQDFLRARWNNTRENVKERLSKMEQGFQELFARGYEEGVVPDIDFEDLESFDWNWLVEWVIENGDSPSVSPESIDLPADRSSLVNEYDLDELPDKDLNRFYEYDSHTTINARTNIITQQAWTMPLDSGDPPRSTEDDELAVAKSWIRANVVTPAETYDRSAARNKLLQLPQPTLESALSSLQSDRTLIPTRNTAGRHFTLNETLVSRLEKSIEASDLQRAVAFKSYLDAAFAAHGEVEWSRHAQNGDMIVLLNLLQSGKVKLRTTKVPANKWGHTDGGYETRQMDKSRLFCDAIVEPTEEYEEGCPLLPLPESPSGKSKMIPLWYDIHDQVVQRLWETALAAVLCIVVTRSGVGVKEVERALRPGLSTWEVELVLDWCVSAGALEASGKGGDSRRYVTKEYWWCVLGSDEDEDADEVVEDGTWPEL